MEIQIKSIIIDDESKSISILKKLINKYCQDVEIIGTAQSVTEAVKIIDELKPNLVFLDITMPDGDGFDVLEKVKYKSFDVIFITASDKFAIKAFEFSAIHYLLKPINYVELQKAIERFKNILDDKIFEDKIQILKETLDEKPKKIILPTFEGLNIISLDEIIHCEADKNYTTFFLTDNRKLLVSKSLNNFDKLLSDINFSRIHNKYLINLKYVHKYIKGKGGYVIMSDKSHVYVSEGKKKDFINSLKKYARSI